MVELGVLVLVGVLLGDGLLLESDDVVAVLLVVVAGVTAALESALPDSPELQLERTAIARTGAIIGATSAFIFLAFILLSSLRFRLVSHSSLGSFP
jgi:hypothetical protein